MSVAQDTYFLCKNIVAFLTGQSARRQDLKATEDRLTKLIHDSSEASTFTASASLNEIIKRFDSLDAQLATPETPQEEAVSFEIVFGQPYPKE